MGYISSILAHVCTLNTQLTYRPVLLSISKVSLPFSACLGRRWTYRHRPAQLQRLAHEQLRALAHHHPARRLHSQGPRNFEHVVKREGTSRVSGAEQLGLRCKWELAAEVACPENAERLWVDKALPAQTIATSHLRLRHPLDDASHCRHTPPPDTEYTVANMSDNKNGNSEDPDELVTKPFKFVTGEFSLPLPDPIANHTHSRYVTSQLRITLRQS